MDNDINCEYPTPHKAFRPKTPVGIFENQDALCEPTGEVINLCYIPTSV